MSQNTYINNSKEYDINIESHKNNFTKDINNIENYYIKQDNNNENKNIQNNNNNNLIGNNNLNHNKEIINSKDKEEVINEYNKNQYEIIELKVKFKTMLSNSILINQLILDNENEINYTFEDYFKQILEKFKLKYRHFIGIQRFSIPVIGAISSGKSNF